MSRKVISLPDWIPQACELMAKYDLMLRQAAAELGVDLAVEEAEVLKDSKLFKGILEEKRLAHYTEIGSNPKLTKEAVVGMIFKLAERLANDHEDFKSADALLKLAKMQGWVGAEPDSVWKAFSVLSQADIDVVRERLKEQARVQQPAQPTIEPEQTVERAN